MEFTEYQLVKTFAGEGVIIEISDGFDNPEDNRYHVKILNTPRSIWFNAKNMEDLRPYLEKYKSTANPTHY